jgi:lipopolysaccharide transport system ATP-binding protein
MKPVIVIDGLSKAYQLGSGTTSRQGAYRTMRESVTDALARPFRSLRRAAAVTQSEAKDGGTLWALRGVTFAVQPGEVLGLVGRNGAGKSTLLKVLSRITAPTAGEIRVRGRVGSLLEVGTGFHPELTGRENIFLNGAILGMPKRDIARRFDEIVAFAEVERFLETPVKRYSSGMYMRLAFAVAAHLESELLLVDEVLAVGDAAFQRKCLGKMSDVSRSGRTVIFVSHNMSAIKSLCTRAVLIEAGKVAVDGSVDEVVNRYLTAGTDMSRTGQIPDEAPRFCDVPGEARIRSVRLTDAAGGDVSQLYFGQPFRIGLTCDVLKEIDDGHFEISISTLDGTQVTYATTIDRGGRPLRIDKGRHEIWADFDLTLLPRQYTIDLGLHHQGGATADFIQRTLDFTVLAVADEGEDHYPWKRTRGLVRPAARWHVGELLPMSSVRG